MLKMVLAIGLLLVLFVALAVWFWVRRARSMAQEVARRRSARFARMDEKRQFAESDYVLAELRREADRLRGDGDATSRDRLTRVEELIGVIESSRSLQHETVDLAGLCSKVAGSFGTANTSRTLRFEPPADAASCAVRGDARALGWVLEELLSNVISHGGDWSTINLRLEAGDQAIRLGFSDDGRGIDLTAAARVYAAFTPRLDSAGPGVGLYAVREIVERHGGRIRACPGAGGGLAHELEFPPAASLARPEGMGIAANAS